MRVNWGYGITAVYTMFAGATLSFVVFAISHPAELVSADYYEQAVAHDRHAAATERAAELGDAVTARVVDAGVAITVPRQPEDSELSGSATLYRASNAGQDRTWPLAVNARGEQILPTAGLASGRWTLKLGWRSGDRDFYAERSVSLP
jgi:hypothetical protein